MLVAPFGGRAWSVAAVAIAMAVGGFLHSRRVATTMSDRTTLNHGQGFASSLATGVLVVAASLGGLPVSTTLVAVGSLAGVGVVSGGANYSVVRNVVMSWIITLPCGALLGGVGHWLLK